MRPRHRFQLPPSKCPAARVSPLGAGFSGACSAHWPSCAPSSAVRAWWARPRRGPSRIPSLRRRRPVPGEVKPRRFKPRSSSRQSWALSRAPSVKPINSFLPSGVAPMMTRMHCFSSSSRRLQVDAVRPHIDIAPAERSRFCQRSCSPVHPSFNRATVDADGRAHPCRAARPAPLRSHRSRCPSDRSGSASPNSLSAVRRAEGSQA